MEEKKCKCHEHSKVEVEQTSFIAYQSGNADPEIMDLVFECIGELVIKLKEHNVRLYSVIQNGQPITPPCGVPGKPPC